MYEAFHIHDNEDLQSKELVEDTENERISLGCIMADVYLWGTGIPRVAFIYAMRNPIWEPITYLSMHHERRLKPLFNYAKRRNIDLAKLLPEDVLIRKGIGIAGWGYQKCTAGNKFKVASMIRLLDAYIEPGKFKLRDRKSEAYKAERRAWVAKFRTMLPLEAPSSSVKFEARWRCMEFLDRRRCNHTFYDQEKLKFHLRDVHKVPEDLVGYEVGEKSPDAAYWDKLYAELKAGQESLSGGQSEC